MDYTKLIVTAWRMTWRHRFLWVLALFAGGLAPGFVGSGGNSGSQVRWDGSDEELRRLLPQDGAPIEQLGQWLAEHQTLLIAIGVGAVAFGALLLLLSLVCQGAVTGATARLARGEETTLREAWAEGLHLFGRYLGLWLTLVGAAALIAVVVAIAAVGLFASISAAPSPGLIALAVLAGVLLMLVAIPVGIVVSLVVAFAQRAIAVQEAGPLEAFRVGWGTLRQHPADSALTWLIAAVLTVGAQVAAGIGLVVVAGTLAAIGFGIWSLAGFTPATIVYIALAVIASIAAGLTLAGIGAAFIWSYWTLAYLHFTGGIETLRASPQPRPPQLSPVPPTP